MELSGAERRQAFGCWLRTGRWPPVRAANGIELKFNPYHDSKDGRFTSGPDGRSAPATGIAGSHASAALAAGPEDEARRGSNSRAFEDPMTLDQAFPGLRNGPRGAVFAAADDLFDLTGPANEMTVDVLERESRRFTDEIRLLDPDFTYQAIGPADALGRPVLTVQGLTTKVNDLRFERAALLAKIKEDYGPLQVETLRFVQQRADVAYDQGEAMLAAGHLTPRLSPREALGNFVDQRVREDPRERYHQFGVDWSGAGPVRVNRREYDKSGTDATYRIPDARINDTAFDVTLTRKTLGTAQVRGFFNTSFRPSRVVIIRPRQVGLHHTYVISRPETKR